MLFNSRNRNLGLDVARTIAISLVLIAHTGWDHILGINLGFLGVEVFFVLSGFLIGQIIAREFKTEITPEGWCTFYINRWLRTFPLYYLILFVKDVLINKSFHLPHYLFIQQDTDLEFFPVSWSLTIEEWFYLLIPFVFSVNIRWLRMSSLRFISLLILISLAARFIYWQQTGGVFDNDLRKCIPLRFDALLVGVIFSQIKINFNDLYKRLSNWRSLAYSAILFVLGYLVYKKYVIQQLTVPAGAEKSFFQSLLFLFFNFSFGFFIIWLEGCAINRLGHKNLITRFFTTISVLTYAIYLVHYDVYKWLIKADKFTTQWLIQALLATSIVIVAALLLHFAIEKPVMDHRKTLIKKLFSKSKREAVSL